MEMLVNAINWFEIPVVDFERAKNFYSAIYDYEMPVMLMGPITMGFLLHEQGKGVGGAIVFGDDTKPVNGGLKLYLNGGKDLQIVLSRVEKAGGKIILSKTLIATDYGYMGGFMDTEGNNIYLHSDN
jgi:uncharacterized protein